MGWVSHSPGPHVPGLWDSDSGPAQWVRPHTKFSSICLGVVPDPTGEGLGPTRLSPRQMPVASSGCHWHFSRTGGESEVPTASSVGLIHLLGWLTEVRVPVYRSPVYYKTT